VLRFLHDIPLAPGEIPAAGEERRPTSRLQFSVGVELAPFVDPYSAIAYDRLVATAAASWAIRANWRVALAFSGATDIYRDQPARRYGGANAVVAWEPARYLAIEAGLFAQAQAGPSLLVYTYREWGGQIAVLLRERLRM
jgi:hypothetical protein